jgi:catechol 2,3-dioxygenase-like lactoylglutathione lyase family enzyme
MRLWTCLSMCVLICGCASTEQYSASEKEVTRETVSAFTTPRVDIGIVVSDVERSVKFYTEGLGFTERPGFDVPAEMGGDSGLSDYKPFHVHVLALDDSEHATNVKLMEFPGVQSERPANDFIHTSLGVSYLTIYVQDITAAVERARRAGALPLAKGPILLPRKFPEGIYLALVRDPDGNMIELVGPKR